MQRFLLITFFLGSYFSSFSQLYIYEISGNELQKPSYILGTFHILCRNDFQKTEYLIDKTNIAEQLVLELDMDDPTMMLKTMKGMAMKGDTTLKMLVGEDEFLKASVFMKDSMSFNLRSVEKVKPFMIYAMLMPKLMDCPVVSIENELVAEFKSKGKEVLGLEEVEDQLGVFDKIPYREQANEFIKGLEEISKTKKEIKESVAFYKNGNFEAILNLSSDPESLTNKYQDELLTKRNLNWIPKIIKIAADKSTFFAVGAGHLVGPNGVLNLLKEKGYEIELVKQFDSK